MKTTALSPALRTQLGKAIGKARRIGEKGARAALDVLAVGRMEPHFLMSEDDRKLRRQLRAHGRQLGDRRFGREQEIGRLAHEVAYEHWQRMLFARFLAENGLLVEPGHRAAVTLDDCRELAREWRDDPWDLAGRFAARMLPEIFRTDDPALAVKLAPEARQGLEELLDQLPSEVFTADDSLGWTYQYWQADRKDQVNRSEVKIGAEELPAVTQLFTERYMVRFLFHNTVGAWRAGRILRERPELATAAVDEPALRQGVRLRAAGGYDFDYLRFVRQPPEEDGNAAGVWRPAAGSFPAWPRTAAALRILDPCCGSGHFLVEGLHVLVRLRMEEESLSLQGAIRAVLRDNLFGLEIDPRCAQIAAFNLALAAWKLAGKAIELPSPNVACSGLAPHTTKEEWISVAHQVGAPGSAKMLRDAMGELHDLFVRAPELGSLLDPGALGGALFARDFTAVRKRLHTVIEQERPRATDRLERAVAARGMARAADLLAGDYTLAITNVPFLARKKHTDTLRSFTESGFNASKGDLATVFLERMLGWVGAEGTVAAVTPHSWLFLTTYGGLREKLLTERAWNFVARLGPGAFQTIGGHVVNVALTVLSGGSTASGWRMALSEMSGPSDSEMIAVGEKARRLRNGPIHLPLQADQLQNPDACILASPVGGQPLLATHCHAYQGIAAADYACFGRVFWEVPVAGDTSWLFEQSTVAETTDFGGREHVLRWKEGEDALRHREGVCIRGGPVWGKQAVVVSQIGHLPVTRYTGEKFDNNASVVAAAKDDLLPAVWSFCSSPDYREAVREIDQKLNVTNGTLVKVPFDVDHWRQIAAESYPHGLPEPYTNDPTQWIFHGHPCGNVVWDEEKKKVARGPLRTDATVLQVALARLLGYRWPAASDPTMRLAGEQRSLVEQVSTLSECVDSDGIACIPAFRGETRLADRLLRLLAAAYGEEWHPAKEQELLRASAPARPPGDLDSWLRNDFFPAHCGLFHNRPFIWHVWDGRPDGFHALVNYHRLAGPDGEGRQTLESLAYSYLGDWIANCRVEVEESREGAEGRLTAALALDKELRRILEGEPPYDLFVRWRPLCEQAIGWEPCLDDGVRLNIRPFMMARLPAGGRKGAGVLRTKPTIHWKKDRGTEPRTLRKKRREPEPKEIRSPSDFPWFWSSPGTSSPAGSTDFGGGDHFDGTRWNDLHYTNEAKRAARKRQSGNE